MAEKIGIKTFRFNKKEGQHCILCVWVCEELIGVAAIGFANRGTDREVNTPFAMDSDVCIGCGSCTYICPTGCIEMVGAPGPPGARRMNRGDLALDLCSNSYKCDSCRIDRQFLDDIKGVV